MKYPKKPCRASRLELPSEVRNPAAAVCGRPLEEMLEASLAKETEVPEMVDGIESFP